MRILGILWCAFFLTSCTNGRFQSAAGGQGDNPPVTYTDSINGPVYGIAFNSATQRTYVVGAFTSVSGISANRIAAFNNDGTIHTNFEFDDGFDAPPRAIEQDQANRLIVTGEFTQYQGVTENRLIRLFTNGDKDTGFITGSGLNGPGYAVDEIEGGTNLYIVGGDFTSYAGNSQPNLVAVSNANGSYDGIVPPVTGGPVYAVRYLNADHVVFAGDFTSPTTRIGEVDSTGVDPTSGGLSGLNAAGRAIFADGSNIFAFGDFDNYKGTDSGRVVHLNGSTGGLLAAYAGCDGPVYAGDYFGTGYVLGGDFSTYNDGTVDHPQSKITAIDATGDLILGWDPGTGFNGPVYAARWNGSKILVGGAFTSYNGVPVPTLVRLNLDGSLDPTFPAD